MKTFLETKARETESVREFTEFVHSGTSAEMQNRFMAITGGATIVVKRGKTGIHGESVTREPFRFPTDVEIEDFFFKAKQTKMLPMVKGAAFLPGTERTEEFDAVKIRRVKGKVSHVFLMLEGKIIKGFPARDMANANGIKKEFEALLPEAQ